MRREMYEVPFRYLKQQGDWCGQRPLVLALILALLLVPGIASADAFVGGIPLTTVQTGTVTGDVYIDATTPTWANQGKSDIVKTFTLPENVVGNISWARLYVSAYQGHMQNDYPFYVLNRWDGNGDGVYSDASPDFIVNETGHAAFNYKGQSGCNDNSALGGTSCDPYKIINDHENRVTSDYFMWYDVTDKIKSRTVSVNVITKGSFDGRTKVATLVVAYNDLSSTTQTRYWVNQGHDVSSYYTETNLGYVAVGSTTFGTAGIGTVSSAVLTVDYMASHNGLYGFPTNNNVNSPGDYVRGYECINATGNYTILEGQSCSYGDIYDPDSPTMIGTLPSITFTKSLATGSDIQGAYSGVMHWDVTSTVNSFPNTNNVTLAYSRDVTQTGLSAFYKIPLAFLVVKSPLPPAANFTANVTTGAAPLAVKFTDTSTASPTSWNWDFGDDCTSTEQSPVHIYTSAGKHTVKLTATNAAGSNITAKIGYITVTSAVPVANFTATPLSGTVPLAVSFTDTSAGSPTSWNWDFGDGNTSAVQNPVHTYTPAGIFNVKLTATNSAGSNTTTRTNYITAGSGTAAPVAAFSATPLSGTAPLTVTFTDASTGNPTGWAWDFGDGNSTNATVQNPVHTYTAAGTYTITLVVTGTGGTNSTAKTGCIAVTSGTGGTPVLSLSPQTQSIDVGESRNYQIVLDSAPDGLAGYYLNVSLATAGVAEITGVAYPSWGQLTKMPTLPNQSILLDATDINHQVQAGATGIVLANITVKGDADGKTTIVFSSVHMDADGGAIISPVVYDGSAVVGNYIGPVAAFSATPLSGTVPLTVQFTDTSTNSPTSWSWDFNNDGDVDSTLQNPSVTYNTYGTYTVTLTVTNNAGSDTITKTNYIKTTVGSSLKVPAAAFTPNVTSGNVPLSVQFTDATTNSPASWSWDFNNDETADSTAQSPVYTYTAAGTYTVTLTATNSGGSNTTSTTVNVLPVSGFTATPTYGTVPLAVTFVDTSTAGSADLWYWKWTFGDGNTSSLESPTFMYKSTGVYTVKLVVSVDGTHWSDAATQAITVNTESGVPGVSFSASPTSGTVPLTVQFTDASSGMDASSGSLSWSWDFGDGNTSAAQNPSHTYYTVGTYDVTLTAKNIKGSASSTISNYISALSASATDCDLSIGGSISPVGGALFAHEPNDVYIYTVQNMGSETCAATTLKLAASDGFSGTTSVSSLAAGATTTVSVTDTTVRSEGKTVTYTATVDPSNTVEEISENNNSVTKSGFTAIWNGYKGKRYMDGGTDVTTQHTYDLHGNIVYDRGNSVYTSGAFGGTWSDLTWEWTASQPSVPSDATITAAYLYVPYTWDNSDQADSATLTFNGETITRSASYKDWSNFGSYANYKYGLIVYDVKSAYAKNSENTAIFHRTDDWAKLSMYEFYLVVIYTDSSKSRKQIFMNENFDLLGASTASYGTNESESTAYVPFTGLTVDTSTMQTATLVTFVPSGNGPEGTLILNGNTLKTNVWDYGGSGTGDTGMPEIAVDSRTVTSYVESSGNVAKIQSTLDSGTPCMAISQAFLIVDYSGTPVAAFSASPTSGTVSLAVTFTDASSNTPTSWSWTFGDGSTSTSQNPTHTYTSVGTYDVTLTATNAKGSDTITKSDLITVSSSSSSSSSSSTSSSTHIDTSSGGSSTSSGTERTSDDPDDSSGTSAGQTSPSSSSASRSQSGPLEKSGSNGSSSGNGEGDAGSDIPSWLTELVLGVLVVVGAGGAVAHVKGYSLGMIAGTIAGAVACKKGLAPFLVHRGSIYWDSPEHPLRTIEVETGLVRGDETSRLSRWWPVIAIIAIIAVALAAAAGLGLLGGLTLPGSDAVGSTSFDVIATVESIRDSDLTNHAPDYPAGFSAHNGILFVYNGKDDIPLDELEVDLTKGTAQAKLTATTRPPATNAVGTGLSSYFEEEGNGDGTLENGEWLMVYADSCYDSSKSDAEPKSRVIGWHPAGTGTSVEVPMHDTIDYVLTDTATGAILQEGTLDFVPST